ncbi:biotin synthase BioB [Psychrilyobacter atlanticus]|uniref:biotin synthase BioB n=1 Tax=Psychrilyobacter atlanticus TaxID=271091 RepID=UPI0003F67DF9|nr:biotin synthase BioB [Psychrilyobacter atlanticus]
MNKINIRSFIDREITFEEALALTEVKGFQLIELFAVANEIREKYCGNKVHTCTISNAKSGKCEENCKFCAQSAHYNTNVTTYDLKTKENLLEEYIKAEKLGSSKFGLVTSGRSIKKGTKDYSDIKKFLVDAKSKKKNVDLCCSIGLLSKDELLELKESGVTRFHSNLQTSIEGYESIVATTHKIDDRIETIKAAKGIGLEVCSGGIIGMGESWKDRIDMAYTLKKLGVDGIPINILNPISGTPHGEREHLSMDEILKTIAIYRVIFRDKVIKIGAGRESILKDFTGMAFLSGANGMLVGGYLTTKGRNFEEDFKLINSIQKLWE